MQCTQKSHIQKKYKTSFIKCNGNRWKEEYYERDKRMLAVMASANASFAVALEVRILNRLPGIIKVRFRSSFQGKSMPSIHVYYYKKCMQRFRCNNCKNSNWNKTVTWLKKKFIADYIVHTYNITCGIKEVTNHHLVLTTLLVPCICVFAESALFFS